MAHDDVENELALLLEASQAEDLSDYLARGRKLKDLDHAQLIQIYVSASKDWADAGGAPEKYPPLSDATAEFHLRRIDPPEHLTEDDRKRVGAAMARIIDGMDDEDQTAMAANIGRRLDDIQGKKN